MKLQKIRTWLGPKGLTLTAAALIGGAFLVWFTFLRNRVPDGFAATHGRAEATEIYIATKTQGRVQEVLVKEGDTVDAGQVLARMDTRTLQAQLRQAQAKVQADKDAKNTAQAVAAQRESDLKLANIELNRAQRLITTNAISQQLYDKASSEAQIATAAWEEAKSKVIEAQAAIDAGIAEADRLQIEIEDGILTAPRRGRIQYRLAEPSEVLPAGGRVLDMVDLSDVYLLFYLPEREAGRVPVGGEARIIFDAVPDAVIPATVYFVAAEAQFTPKTVETKSERQKLAFQVRARIDPELLRKYESRVKTGLPGEIYVRLDPGAAWPQHLGVHIPERRVAQR